jgi:SAM-dependent methyltransferase
VTTEERWLAALWPKVRLHLPPAPAGIVEIGCGRLGGFIPRLRESGYEAVGIDPLAPEGDHYRQIEFEQSDLAEHVDAVIASTSLHHVTEPGEVLHKIANALAADGRVVVVEWDWEIFDEETARWCFERLERSGAESWLHRRRDEWTASRRPWEDYLRAWAHQHGLHSARRLVEDLDRHFQRVSCTRGAYFFPELFETSEADELDAISSGQIRAARVDYVGRLADTRRRF